MLLFLLAYKCIDIWVWFTKLQAAREFCLSTWGSGFTRLIGTIHSTWPSPDGFTRCGWSLYGVTITPGRLLCWNLIYCARVFLGSIKMESVQIYIVLCKDRYWDDCYCIDCYCIDCYCYWLLLYWLFREFLVHEGNGCHRNGVRQERNHLSVFYWWR